VRYCYTDNTGTNCCISSAPFPRHNMYILKIQLISDKIENLNIEIHIIVVSKYTEPACTFCWLLNTFNTFTLITNSSVQKLEPQQSPLRNCFGKMFRHQIAIYMNTVWYDRRKCWEMATSLHMKSQQKSYPQQHRKSQHDTQHGTQHNCKVKVKVRTTDTW